MRATGIVRRMDHLGRVVVPRELREKHCLTSGMAIEFLDSDKTGVIGIQIYRPGCFLCSSAHDLRVVNDRVLCMDCIRKMVEYLDSDTR